MCIFIPAIYVFLLLPSPRTISSGDNQVGRTWAQESPIRGRETIGRKSRVTLMGYHQPAGEDEVAKLFLFQANVQLLTCT